MSDLALTLQGEARDLGRGLHPDSAAELRDLTRIMNAYYSNLIEGHNTRPRDIEAALEGCLDEVADRPLAEEGAAHVHVQSWNDARHAAGDLAEPTSVAFIRDLHRRFYEEMPEAYRFIEHDGKRVRIEPGAVRDGHEVAVGAHLPPSAHRLDAFMAHFETRYRGLTRGGTRRILSIPAAHHRQNYIHPFPDGNGRVSRLMSHAMCQTAGIGAHGLWSVSRGLARGLRDPAEYKERMRMADTPRQGSRDGRGTLSRTALEGLTGWFLTTALDQVRFTASMFDIEGLRDRCRALLGRLYPRNERLPVLVDHVLRHGEMRRGDARLVTGSQDRVASKDLKTLTEAGFLKSGTPKGPVRVGFPLAYRESLFPNLFADVEPVVPAPPDVPGL